MSKPVVLHVLHPWGGGTEKHVLELCKNLNATTLSLIVTPLGDEIIWLRSADANLGIDFKRPAVELLDLAKSLNVSLVHIHQLIGHTTDFKTFIAELGVPFYVTIHDYTLVCPQINFVTSAGSYCNESTDNNKCNSCLSGGCQFGTTDITVWRDSLKWAIADAAKVICPSMDTVTRCKKYIPDANYVVVPHEEILAPPVTPIVIKENEPLRVAVLGKITLIKGNQVLTELVALAKQQQRPIEFTVIGHIVGMYPPQTDQYFKQTGAYQDSQLLDIIADVDPHVILFPAIWPETYSYTLTAAIQSGRAIIAPDFGSFPERVAERKWTWLFNSAGTVKELFALLSNLQQSPQQPKLIDSTSNDTGANFYTKEYLTNIENKNMEKNTILMTSALYTNYGIYSKDERILQTLETVSSVRKYIPNATIILIDASTTDIQQDTSPELTQLLDSVDYYIDYSDDPDFQHFHNNVENYDIGKNSMESMAMLKTLQYISTDPELMNEVTSSARIFKLSGRYQVTEQFDISKFDNEKTKDKYVFKLRGASWIPQADTGVDHQLYTRLWSFPPSLFFPTITIYQDILKNMFDTNKRGKYIDIEHSMARFIPKESLIELAVVGVKGNIAPNGAEVKE